MADLRSVGVAVGLVLALAGCGNGSGQQAVGVAASNVKPLQVQVLSGKPLGLNVTSEKLGKALSGKALTYLDRVSLYSLRQDKLVMATVQIGELIDKPRYRTTSFRNDLVVQLASGVKPSQVVVDGTTVYLTRGTKQSLAVWFRGRLQYVMSIREDYETPRALIRALVTGTT